MIAPPPVRIRDIAPTKGPMISRVVVEDGCVLLAEGGTLPPVCVITGKVMPPDEAHYELVYLNYLAGAHRGSEDACSAGVVRLPFSTRGIRIYRAARLFRQWSFFVISAFIMFYFGVRDDHPWRGIIYYLTIPTMVAVGWTVALGVSFTARRANGGTLALTGIKPHIQTAILAWQSQHPEVYSPKP